MSEQEQPKNFFQQNKKFILIMSALLVLGGAWIFMGGEEDKEGTAQVGMRTSDTGRPIESTDPQYASQVREHNALRAQAASQAGGSHFDTLTAKEASAPIDPFAQSLTSSAPAAMPTMAASAGAMQPQGMMQQPVVYQHTIIKEVAVTPNTEYNWRNDPTLITFFANQNPNMQAGGPQGQPQQGQPGGGFQYNQGYVAQQQALQQQAQAQAQAQMQAQGQQAANGQEITNVAIKRNGDMAPATLLTPVDTTRPSIVRARIESGELAGSIVTGNFERADTSVSLNFTSIIIPGVPQSIPIQAVAMDLKTASTALSTSVNRHIPERLLMTFVSAFAESYSEVLSTNNTSSRTSTSIDSATGNSSQISTSDTTKKTAGEINKEAGSKAISEATRIANDMVPTQPTVKVRTNHEIAVYFTADMMVPRNLLVNAKNSQLSKLQ